MVTIGVLVALAADGGGRFQRLDSLIVAQPQIVAAKEARLTQLKSDLGKETTAPARYAALKRLYEEYSASACGWPSR